MSVLRGYKSQLRNEILLPLASDRISGTKNPAENFFGGDDEPDAASRRLKGKYWHAIPGDDSNLALVIGGSRILFADRHQETDYIYGNRRPSRWIASNLAINLKQQVYFTLSSGNQTGKRRKINEIMCVYVIYLVNFVELCGWGVARIRSKLFTQCTGGYAAL